MIDSLPEDSFLFNLLFEYFNNPFKFYAEVLDHKSNAPKDPWLNIDKFKY